VRPVVALVLACAVVAASTAASSMHVHEYVGHDHPDHHHGPATHEHERAAHLTRHHDPVDDHHPTIDAEPCDPGRHAVSVSVGSVSVPPLHVDLAELTRPIVVAPSAPARSRTAITDVRVHGPPCNSEVSSRAPPF
jgi:hypothetical protein